MSVTSPDNATRLPVVGAARNVPLHHARKGRRGAPPRAQVDHPSRPPLIAYFHHAGELSWPVAYKVSEALGHPYLNILPSLLLLAY